VTGDLVTSGACGAHSQAGPRIRLAVRRYGRGEPLVLLHGLFGSASQWHHIAVRLAEAHEVLAVDLRNHGNSPHEALMDYPTMADDVDSLLESNGLEDAHVLGHSMGGKVAMTMALRTPRRVKRLTVVDIAPVVYADALRPLVCAALRLDLAAIATREEADRMLATHVPSAAVRAMLLQNLVRRDGAWAWRIHWAAIADNLTTLLGFPPALACERSELPVLFIRGGASDHLRPEHRPAIEARFPRAALRTIAGAGHWVQADQPGELVRVIRTWLT
jgi:esterase